MTVNPVWPPQTPASQQLTTWCTQSSGVSFPIYTGDPLTAFDDIQTALGVPDLRWMYANNLNANVNTLISTLDEMTQPANVTSADDWNTVKTQILAELNAVSQVRQMLAPTGNVPTFVNDVFASDAVSVSMVQNLLDADTSDSCSVSVFGMISDFLWALSSVGDTAGAILNTMSALAAAASSLNGGFTDLSDEVGEIQAALLAQIDLLNTQAGQWLAFLCGDWGNLQSVAAAILDGTLAWSQPSTLVATCQNAYEIDLWQALLPLVVMPWGSVYTHESNDADYGDSDCSCVSMQAAGWAFNSQYSSSGVWNAYWLVVGMGKWWSPPQASCDRMFGYLNINKNDVMNGTNGWPGINTLNVLWDDPSCVPKH
ncbi:MAG TPA: hypothetical protein VGQ36_00095 [Thermoanaerobaculia bacterium]|jgi:hypothetical protein|nr:hypothetical protein [Thermoanaerobaculia bacterium]